VSVTDSPVQIIPSLLASPEVSVKEMTGETELTVTDADTEAKQAVDELVTVTVYDAVEVGDTTLPFPAALIGTPQAYVIPLVGLAVRVTASPRQIIPSSFVVPEVSAKAMVGLGKEFTVTGAEAEAEHAVVESVTVTL
jgi:hypothetical protein